MQKLFRAGLMMLSVSFLLTACQPDAHKELDAPRNILASLEGTWKLTKATQVDESAKAKGFPFKEIDITTLFPYTDFRITFNLNAGAPGTFTTVPGASPKIIKLTSGTWSVDNAASPKNITLTSGASTEVTTLGGYPVGASNTLKLAVARVEAATGKTVITYSYEFAKQ
ncbi:hypothetical protein CAP36_07355 [Chitinophagaceae bacterium IBVUCB2]|nr:hypothetical protein CAP36_07355 [Chitinophagaceae bacterium IBVUCB2]